MRRWAVVVIKGGEGRLEAAAATREEVRWWRPSSRTVGWAMQGGGEPRCGWRPRRREGEHHNQPSAVIKRNACCAKQAHHFFQAVCV